jgi:hypothetical protein
MHPNIIATACSCLSNSGQQECVDEVNTQTMQVLSPGVLASCYRKVAQYTGLTEDDVKMRCTSGALDDDILDKVAVWESDSKVRYSPAVCWICPAHV